MSLSVDQQRILAQAIMEAKAMGLSIRYPQKEARKINWNLGANGYFVRTDGKLFAPNENQKNFIVSRARFAGYVGARGSGKTASGAQKALFKIMQGEAGAVMNPDFEQFRSSTWPELRLWIPWDMVVPRQRVRAHPEWEPHKPFTLVFTNGARVICKGLKDPDAARGPNINWLWYDEGQRDIDGLGWQLAVAAVRVGHDPQAWVTFTPRGLGHWTYKLFVKQDISEESFAAFAGQDRPLVEWFRGSIDDNKDNLDPGFYASLLAAYPPGYLRDQELKGEFVEAGGILGDPAWFKNKIIAKIPEDVIIKAYVRYWDLAASEKKVAGKRSDDPDETVGTLMAWDGKDFYIMDQVCGYWGYDQIKQNIALVAEQDSKLVSIYIEQEPGAGGKNQVADIAKLESLSGYTVREHKPEGDKVLRANLWFGEAAQGRVYLIRGSWIDGFLEQLSSFPIMRHDDRIDSVSGARMCIAPIRKWKQVEFLAIRSAITPQMLRL